MSKVWSSYYGGNCGNCGNDFPIGTRVTWEGGVLVEAECDPQRADAGMGPKERALFRGAMCIKCFIVHSPGQKECA